VQLKSPVTYPGSKTAIAHHIWDALGDVHRYTEPFCGSATTLLARPHRPGRYETIGDYSGLVVNYLRAVRDDPEKISAELYRLQPWTQADHRAWSLHLKAISSKLRDLLQRDPLHYDLEAAAAWTHGQSAGLTHQVYGQQPGQGPHTMNTTMYGRLATGLQRGTVAPLLHSIADRLRDVQILCGDWRTTLHGHIVADKDSYKQTCGVFIDPPYASQRGSMYELRDTESTVSITAEVEEWALATAGPLLRIVVAGYLGDYPRLDEAGWYSRECGPGANSRRLRRDCLWYSPGCLNAREQALF